MRLSKREFKAKTGLALLLILFVIGISPSYQYSPVVDSISNSELDDALFPSQTEIDILFMMDHEYGANYHFIRPIMEGWGWNVTIAGTAETLSPCSYQSASAVLDTDILISEIDDITEYDIISIMPGDSHALLLTDSYALSLIQTAVDEGLVVSAWCKAVRVLAAADVINGLNVTGNAEYEDEYEAAGAIYMGIVPPVIQDNIVTGVRSRYYRQEMCIAIATAAGVYETDVPTISEVSLDATSIVEGNWTLLTATVSDATGVSEVVVSIYALNSTGGRNTTLPLVSLDMMNFSGDLYSANVSGLVLGSYVIDIEAKDVFDNSGILEEAASLDVVLPGFSLPTDLLLIGLVGGGIGVIVLIGVIVKIRKS